MLISMVFVVVVVVFFGGGAIRGLNARDIVISGCQ